MLTRLMAKWRGSDEAMLAFAREGASAQPGTVLAGLLAVAFNELERAGDLDDGMRPGAVAEVAAAFDASFPGTEPVVGDIAVVALNDFAYWFDTVDDIPRLARALSQMGAAVTASPWGHGALGSEGTWRAACKRAGMTPAV